MNCTGVHTVLVQHSTVTYIITPLATNTCLSGYVSGA